jgi:hypothetical protein
MRVGDGVGVIVTIGDGGGVGGSGEGVMLGRGGRVIDAKRDGRAVLSISTGVAVVSASWQATTNNNRVLQNLFLISLYHKARIIE